MGAGFTRHPAKRAARTAGGNRRGHQGNELLRQASEWATPVAPSGGRTLNDAEVLAKGATEAGKRQVDLANQARVWSTPAAVDSESAGSPKRPALTAEARAWSTPNARDHKGQDIPGRNGSPSLPAQVMRRDGETTSQRAVLNPRFVAALMGFPRGWTSFERSGMLSSPPRQPSPSECSPVA